MLKYLILSFIFIPCFAAAQMVDKSPTALKAELPSSRDILEKELYGDTLPPESLLNQEKPNNDVYIVYHREYEKLYYNCGISTCCKASVYAMRSVMAQPFSEKRPCPKGHKRTSLMCPASYAWCIPEDAEPPR